METRTTAKDTHHGDEATFCMIAPQSYLLKGEQEVIIVSSVSLVVREDTHHGVQGVKTRPTAFSV